MSVTTNNTMHDHDKDDVSPLLSQKTLIALIDGATAHRRQAERGLTSFYQVASFSDVTEALSVLDRTPPLVVVVDETIGPSGGISAVKRLRADTRLKGLRIIATSALPDSTFLSGAKTLGCDAILQKPILRSVLISTLSGLVNQSIEKHWKRLVPRHQVALRLTLGTFNGISDVIDHGEPITFASVRDACTPLVTAVERNDFKALLNGVRGYDNYSYVHSLRVAIFLSMFGHAMGLENDDLLVLSLWRAFA